MRRVFASLLIIIAYLTGSALAQSAATTQDTTPDATLKLLWTMRNTGGPIVEDSSLAGHNGALVGNAYFKQDPPDRRLRTDHRFNRIHQGRSQPRS